MMGEGHHHSETGLSIVHLVRQKETAMIGGSEGKKKDKSTYLTVA